MNDRNRGMRGNVLQNIEIHMKDWNLKLAGWKFQNHSFISFFLNIILSSSGKLQRENCMFKVFCCISNFYTQQKYTCRKLFSLFFSLSFALKINSDADPTHQTTAIWYLSILFCYIFPEFSTCLILIFSAIFFNFFFYFSFFIFMYVWLALQHSLALYDT